MKALVTFMRISGYRIDPIRSEARKLKRTQSHLLIVGDPYGVTHTLWNYFVTKTSLDTAHKALALCSVY